MCFAKTTRRTTVFSSVDVDAPVRTVYVNTAALRAHGSDRSDKVLIISDASLSDAETPPAIAVHMDFSRKTRRTTVFTAVDGDAPVQTFYVNTDFLHSHGGGTRRIFLGISDARPVEYRDEDAGDAGDRFEAFLRKSVAESPGSRITAGRIWSIWASRCGADPGDDLVAGIHRRAVAPRFRECFGAPPASRGRVDGRVQYYWLGYEIA